MNLAARIRFALLLSVLSCGWASPCSAQRVAEQQKRTEADYVRWLEQRSMLYQAREQARRISGHGRQWQHPYGEPRPRDAVRLASVWLLDYPGSVITPRGQSVIETWGEPELWEALEHIGVELLHTGPIKQAGGVRGRRYTPTIDGWFDPISIEIDPDLGTDRAYQRLVQTAQEHGGSIAGDLIPLHTGIGPDFRLATRRYKDYPGMYTMVEILEQDWDLLPDAEGPWETAVIPKQDAEALYEKGYLPGLINSNDATPKARELSGWSATGEVRGVDGKVRRWAFLHYFKKEQPALNWLDPSFAAQRAISGDIVKTVHTLGARVMRLDAVPFLGIEPKSDDPLSEHFKHPLSVQGTNSLAFMIRKLGGFSFHELNVPLQDLKKFTEHGPDLSYDFFTRAQCLHALLIQDATLLRQAFQFLLDADVQPVSLVHDLQNHDEITYQLVELEARGDETFEIDGREVTGRELREQMLAEMRAKASGDRAPHNKLYRVEKDGLATTFAAFVAAALEIHDPYHATRREVDRIQQGHLLLAAANAMQPGVFSLSSWDLVGALPIPEESVKERIDDGDYRWVNRGGVDLMGFNPDAEESAFGLERAETLYGSLPEQFDDPDSFVERLGRMLKARRKYRIAEGTLLAAPEVENRSACILVMQSPKSPVVVTAINFAQHSIREELNLAEIDELSDTQFAGTMFDIISDEDLGELPKSGRMMIELPALTARTIVIDTDDH
jgi:trehalose synthase